MKKEKDKNNKKENNIHESFPHGTPTMHPDPSKSEQEQLSGLIDTIRQKRESKGEAGERKLEDNTDSPSGSSIDVSPECAKNNAFHSQSANTQALTAWPTNYSDYELGFSGAIFSDAAAYKRENNKAVYSFDLTGKDLSKTEWLSEDERALLENCSPLSEVKQQATREMLEGLSKFSDITWQEAKTDEEKKTAISVTECDWSDLEGEGTLAGYAPSKQSYDCGSEY